MKLAILTTLVALLQCTHCVRIALPHQEVPHTSTSPVATLGEGRARQCNECILGLRVVDDVLSNSPIQKSLESFVLDELCKGKTKAKECEANVSVVMPLVLLSIGSSSSPVTQCKAVCGEAVGVESVPAYPLNTAEARVSQMECPFCEFVAEELQEVVKTQKEQKEILDEVRMACKNLPPSFADTCVEYVNEKGPLIIALLESEPPMAICKLLGACRSPSLVSPAVSGLPLELASVVARLGSLKLAATCPMQSELYSPSGLHDNPQACEFCKIAVMELKVEIENPAFQKAVFAYTKKLCKKLSPDFSAQCIESVDEYGPLLFSLAESYLRDSVICTELLHLCPKQPYVSDAALISQSA